MGNEEERNSMRSIEFEFVRGHIAATMALIHGFVQQGSIDGHRLADFLKDFLASLPHTRDTLALRLIVDQWRQGLLHGQSAEQLRRHMFSVIDGGKSNAPDGMSESEGTFS